MAPLKGGGGGNATGGNPGTEGLTRGGGQSEGACGSRESLGNATHDDGSSAMADKGESIAD